MPAHWPSRVACRPLAGYDTALWLVIRATSARENITRPGDAHAAGCPCVGLAFSKPNLERETGAALKRLAAFSAVFTNGVFHGAYIFPLPRLFMRDYFADGARLRVCAVHCLLSRRGDALLISLCP